jgi:formylglycine-generating enzyme required for sulfatase activity
MGADHHHPEEAPAHRVIVNSFWIDRTPVTNGQFRQFVEVTGHKTYAEIPPNPMDYAGALPEMLYAAPGGAHMANTWQGEFPRRNLNADGYERTSPVKAFAPNGYGLYDMIGNVWEWTSDWWSTKHEADAPKACCIPENPRGGRERDSYDPRLPNIKIPRKVLKGGSHLCATNYCRRYRPAARHAEPIDTSAGHVGFRCTVRKRSTS